MKSRTHSRERAFILRCWFEDEQTGWRFILEPIEQDQQRNGFTNLRKLLSFLEWNLEYGGEDENPTRLPNSLPIKE